MLIPSNSLSDILCPVSYTFSSNWQVMDNPFSSVVFDIKLITVLITINNCPASFLNITEHPVSYFVPF